MRKILKIGLASILFVSGAHALAAGNADNDIKTVEMLRNQAVQSQFLGNADEALEKYLQAIDPARRAFGENAPYLAEIYYDMGALCLASSKFEKAESFLNQALKLNPNCSAAHLRLSELKLLHSRSDEAARHANAVLARHRDDLVAHKDLALAYETGDDSRRAYREFAAVDQLIQFNRDIYEGRQPQAKIVLPVLIPAVDKPAESAGVNVEAKKKAEKDRKDAEAAGKKAESEAKKKTEADSKKKADVDFKKKAEKAKKDAEAARKKAESEVKKKAEAESRKKAAKARKASPAKAPENPAPGEVQATLSSKAVLLTPIKKKPAATESTTTETSKPGPDAARSDSAHEEETVKAAKPAPVKKPAKAPEETPKAEARVVTPKPGKHASGLVPPPPPVMPTYVMAPPPQKPKPQPKKEEKVKEPPAVREEKPEKPGVSEEEGDFLLDWGGAKGKKKK